ncbi:MAG: MATE family efflux transporter, partial [Oscillospiraceae bacterium]|nr:MATE family efflux transporter [Oscillospiraceae bacterium]
MQKIQLSDHFTYKKLFLFCLPSIIMMVFTSIYGVVDGFFISNVVGKIPFAAVNIIFPFIMIVNSFGFMIGTGGSALVAKTLGENDPKNANRYFTM